LAGEYEESNLTVQIAALRKALGPSNDGYDWIVTVPRVGYRLVLPQSDAVEMIGLPKHARTPWWKKRLSLAKPG
jgi:DNA-binding winged helix-turn-helix (wHTH) protein